MLSSKKLLPLRTLLFAGFAHLIGLALAAPARPASAKWESEIQAFETADKTNPPPAGGIVFVGSSSIRLWKTLQSDFADKPVINRGFGGSQMEDSVALADRIVLRYRPRQVFVYAGDNDIAAGKKPAQIVADFRAFVEKVHQALPMTTIDYIAIKPSPSRWNLVDQVRAANRLVEEFTRTDPKLRFVDVFTPMIGPDEKPREDLFIADRLHMNAKGYALWTELIRPLLDPTTPAQRKIE